MSDTSSRQRFSVATANPDGSETLTPMKTWLRQHPDSLLGADLESVDVSQKNSRYIFRRLLIHGWNSRETPEEIRLFPPGAPPPDIEDGDLVDDDDPAYGSFRMETELRDFLANNLNLVKINESRLRLYADQNKRNGVEYPTATGPIDILAIDDSGAFYVFELKRAASPDSAIGQITRYMGWAMETLADGRPVYGLIVAKEITERLKYAVLAIPNVSLFEYQVAFTLRPITRGA